MEGIARHPDGTWYISSGNSNSTLSPNLSTVDLDTAVIANLGAIVTTLQNDIDLLFFKGTTLYGFDVNTDANLIDLFTFNLATGANTRVAAPTQTDETLRIAYDGSRDKAFAWRVGDRNLLQMDLQTAAVTPIGETHPATTFAGASIRAFFVGPAPHCP